MSHGNQQPPDRGAPVQEHAAIQGIILQLFGDHHSSFERMIAALAAEVKQDDRTILAALVRIEAKLDRPSRHGKLVLLQPTLTTLQGIPIMAAYALKTDVVAHFVVTETNPATGALVPVDPADVFTVTSSDPANLNAAVATNAAGQTEIAVNWLHTTSPMLTGVGISITDSQGNTADNAETFDMVPPTHVAAQIGLDIAGVTETPQPVAV